MSKEYKSDITIIGAGPVGLFTAFQCGMLGLRAHVIDALPEAGGQCTALYPEKPIYDIPGCPEILAARLIENLERQAKPFEPVYHLGQKAEKLERLDNRWSVTTSADVRIDAGAVIIATGAGAFGPNRPPLENIEEFEGKSVFYMVRRKEDFAGKRVVIAGGGDSAVDWALGLCCIARKVYVVHRRDRFRAVPQSVDKLQAMTKCGNIELVTPYQLKSIEGADGKLEALNVATLDGEERALEADVLLPFYGLATEPGPFEEWGVKLEQNRVLIEQSTGQTNLPGVYAVGDIAQYPGKLRLILTGFAEAAQAVHSAHNMLHPELDLHFEYSTSKGLPRS